MKEARQKKESKAAEKKRKEDEKILKAAGKEVSSIIALKKTIRF